MPETADQFIGRLRDAFERAQRERESLDYTIPSPLRDTFFDLVVRAVLKEKKVPHAAASCEGCQEWALRIALSALGWENREAPRPSATAERMAVLLEQVGIALEYVEKLHQKALDRYQENIDV